MPQDLKSPQLQEQVAAVLWPSFSSEVSTPANITSNTSIASIDATMIEWKIWNGETALGIQKWAEKGKKSKEVIKGGKSGEGKEVTKEKKVVKGKKVAKRKEVT